MNIIPMKVPAGIIRVIKKLGALIAEAFRPNYEDWMPKEKDVNGNASNSLANSPKHTLEEKNSSDSADNVRLEEKNKEIAALQAKLAEYQKQLGETEPFKNAIIKIKEALASGVSVKRVGRPSKNRAKRTVKIDTVLLIVYGFARENGLFQDDFSSVLNSSLHLYFKEQYPAAYSIYEKALEDVDHVY